MQMYNLAVAFKNDMNTVFISILSISLCSAMSTLLPSSLIFSFIQLYILITLLSVTIRLVFLRGTAPMFSSCASPSHSDSHES